MNELLSVLSSNDRDEELIIGVIPFAKYSKVNRDGMINGELKFGESKSLKLSLDGAKNIASNDDNVRKYNYDSEGITEQYPYIFDENINIISYNKLASPQLNLFKSMIKSNMPNDKAIVLDLDETLVHTFNDFNLYSKLGLDKISDLTTRIYKIQMRDVVTHRGQGVITTMWGVIRPHVREFLLFCFSYFKAVIVWSAGKYGYVHEIVKILFSGMQQPHAILTRDDCTQMDGNFDKNLNKLFNDKILGKYVRPDNTIIVDDRTVSFSTCPNNGVLIPAYSPEARIPNMKSDDISLLQLKTWLLNDNIRNSEDITKINKSEIFTKDMSVLFMSSKMYKRDSNPIDLSSVYNKEQSY